MKHPMPVALTLAALLSLGGCASEKELMVEQGYPIAYADGFDDGCHSGRQAGGSILDQFRKDVTRFERDDRYAQGWYDGFRQCESGQQALER